MKLNEAKTLIEEIESLVGDGPGMNDRKLDRCKGIVRQVMNHQSSTYLSEKASSAIELLEIWFSPRRWKRYGPPEHMRQVVLTDVMKFGYALDEHFHER